MARLAPTAKVTAVGATGSVITLVLQLLQQYVPGFHAPSAATVSLIITVLATGAGWLTKEFTAAKPAAPPAEPPGNVTVIPQGAKAIDPPQRGAF